MCRRSQLPRVQQRQQQRCDEHSLKLERDRHTERDHRPRRTAAHQQIHRRHQRRTVDRVGLPPVRPVQNHRRCEEDRQRTQRTQRSHPAHRILHPHQQIAERRQHEIERQRDQLDRHHIGKPLQRGRGERQQIEIGRRVIRVQFIQPGQPAVGLQVVVPPPQVDRVIQRLVVQQHHPNQQRHPAANHNRRRAPAARTRHELPERLHPTCPTLRRDPAPPTAASPSDRLRSGFRGPILLEHPAPAPGSAAPVDPATPERSRQA